MYDELALSYVHFIVPDLYHHIIVVVYYYNSDIIIGTNLTNVIMG